LELRNEIGQIRAFREHQKPLFVGSPHRPAELLQGAAAIAAWAQRLFELLQPFFNVLSIHFLAPLVLSGYTATCPGACGRPAEIHCQQSEASLHRNGTAFGSNDERDPSFQGVKQLNPKRANTKYMAAKASIPRFSLF
jgi:hypothetical protein